MSPQIPSFKTVDNDDTWEAMAIVKKSQGQLEMVELELLRIKARKGAIAVSNLCMFFPS